MHKCISHMYIFMYIRSALFCGSISSTQTFLSPSHFVLKPKEDMEGSGRAILEMRWWANKLCNIYHIVNVHTESCWRRSRVPYIFVWVCVQPSIFPTHWGPCTRILRLAHCPRSTAIKSTTDRLTFFGIKHIIFSAQNTFVFRSIVELWVQRMLQVIT